MRAEEDRVLEGLRIAHEALLLVFLCLVPALFFVARPLQLLAGTLLTALFLLPAEIMARYLSGALLFVPAHLLCALALLGLQGALHLPGVTWRGLLLALTVALCLHRRLSGRRGFGPEAAWLLLPIALEGASYAPVTAVSLSQAPLIRGLCAAMAAAELLLWLLTLGERLVLSGLSEMAAGGADSEESAEEGTEEQVLPVSPALMRVRTLEVLSLWGLVGAGLALALLATGAGAAILRTVGGWLGAVLGKGVSLLGRFLFWLLSLFPGATGRSGERFDPRRLLGPAGRTNPLWDVLWNILVVITVAAFVFLVLRGIWELLHRLSEDFAQSLPEVGSDRRILLSGEQKREGIHRERRRERGALSARRRIRRLYVRLLRRGNTSSLTPADTPSQMEEKALGAVQGQAHELYERARYSAEEITRQEAEQMRQAVRRGGAGRDEEDRQAPR